MTIQNRADNAIAQGCLTNSKRQSTFIEGIYPTHASGAAGALIKCEKANYVDYICGLGTNLLGYGQPAIGGAILKQYLKGSTISLSTELEVALAEKLKGLFLFTDLWKFTKTGSEACGAAIKIARAFTGRDLVLSDGYHGNFDDFVYLTEPALGIPKRSWMGRVDFSRIKEAAAVIVEPVMLDYSRDRKAYLETLRAECTKHGTVLIFDEIITGFRFPGLSVSKYFGIFPDLILLGKAMGGGLPLSAIGGRKDIMSGDYFVSGTFFGEACAMAACMQLIDIIHRDGSKFNITELWEKGELFLEQFNRLHPKLKIVGYPSRGVFQGDDMVKALFWQEACKAGILFGPSWFFNFPLIEYTDKVLPILRDIMTKILTGNVMLEGKMPRAPLAQIQRENG